VLVSLLLAFVLGAALGVTMGLFKGVRTYARPLLHMIQGVPALSWVVFAVIWFAQVEVRIAFILLIGTLPAFALYIDSAVQSVNLDLIHLGQAFRASRTQSLTKIILPAIVPEIMSAWTVNLGNGVRVAVIAELIGSTVGVAIFGTLLTNSLNAKLLAWSAGAGLPPLNLSTLRNLSATAQVHSSVIDVPQPIRILISDSVTHVFLLSLIVVVIALIATSMIPELPMRERPKVPPKEALPAETHL